MVPDAGDADDAAEPGDTGEATGAGPSGGCPPDGDSLGTLGEGLAAADDPVWLRALTQAIGGSGPDDPAGTVLPGAPREAPDPEVRPHAGVDGDPPTPT